MVAIDVFSRNLKNVNRHHFMCKDILYSGRYSIHIISWDKHSKLITFMLYNIYLYNIFHRDVLNIELELVTAYSLFLDLKLCT